MVAQQKSIFRRAFLILLIISLIMISILSLVFIFNSTDTSAAIYSSAIIKTNKSSNSLKTDTHYDKTIYVLSAYLLTSSQIRITTIRKCNSSIRLHIRLIFDNGTDLSTILFHKPIQPCPWFFAKMCDFVGYVTATMKWNDLQKTLLTRKNELPKAYVYRHDQPDNQHPIKLYDARVISTERKHQLAVCLQPIFLLADWTLLIQFFETWIYQGATKFFIYVQSMTPEVDALLKVYENTNQIDVERINWGLFPSDANDSDANNPNMRVYRGEVISSINDCVMRSRGQTKYVVSSDLDEIIVSFKELLLLNFIEDIGNKHKKAAAFVIRSVFAFYENEWLNVAQPENINFDVFANISYENYIWPAGMRSKVIMIPEDVYNTHVHQILQIKSGKNVVIVPPEDAVLYHLRRLMRDDLWSSNATLYSDDLKKFVEPCNKSWKKRLKKIPTIPEAKILHQKIWPNRGAEVMQDQEKCRCILAKFNNTCPSLYKCLNRINGVNENEWIWAEQTWISI